MAANADSGALALLSDILVEETEWTLADVRRLLRMRELAELGHWRADGLEAMRGVG